MSRAQEMFIGGRCTAAASGASFEHRGWGRFGPI